MSPKSKDSEVKEVFECFVWSCTRDPSLVLKVTDQTDPRSALECWIYSAWHWDAHDAVDILVAMKVDDAQRDFKSLECWWKWTWHGECLWRDPSFPSPLLDPATDSRGS
jgi:hypothetical protein